LLRACPTPARAKIAPAVLSRQELLLEAFGVERTRELRRERVDLCEIVREVLSAQESALRKSACRASLIAVSPVTGNWDRERLRIAIHDLVANAHLYGCGHPIDAAVGGDAASAWVSVRDYGVGIAAADRERVFEPFVRASSPAVRGAGLGLWLARTIVHAHAGSISLQSTIGEGANFTIRLPRS
jgi:signal transduction histidine kinase